MKSRYQPVAVIDIGSNSVRLVIYEGPWRHASALHNEKAICAIGRNMVSTGHLDQEGTDYAIETLKRFRSLCDGYGVKDFGAVATAAARDAINGKEFVRDAEKALGQPIRILSGEDEAKMAAEGTLAGIPSADGLVADLGGGSLDMVKVKDGKTGAATTLPFGPLRLMDLSDGNLNKARNAVEKGLDKSDFAGGLKGRALYAVGGIWRALAHVDMEQQSYPLRVLHHYIIPAKRAIQLCRVVAGLGRKTLEKMHAVPKRRAEALPYGALVMEEMIHAFGLKDVVISAYGLREGVLVPLPRLDLRARRHAPPRARRARLPRPRQERARARAARGGRDAGRRVRRAAARCACPRRAPRPDPAGPPSSPGFSRRWPSARVGARQAERRRCDRDSPRFPLPSRARRSCLSGPIARARPGRCLRRLRRAVVRPW